MYLISVLEKKAISILIKWKLSTLQLPPPPPLYLSLSNSLTLSLSHSLTCLLSYCLTLSLSSSLTLSLPHSLSLSRSLFGPKNDNDQKNAEQKYNGFKEKIFTNKKMPHFNDILIRTREIAIISYNFSSEPYNQSRTVLLLKISMIKTKSNVANLHAEICSWNT